MVRPIKVPDSINFTVRISSEMYESIKEIAALETLSTGKVITTNQLIRDALQFVYGDNERLRESFRRSRVCTASKYKKYCG